jgi:hypothetical protein
MGNSPCKIGLCSGGDALQRNNQRRRQWRNGSRETTTGSCLALPQSISKSLGSASEAYVLSKAPWSLKHTTCCRRKHAADSYAWPPGCSPASAVLPCGRHPPLGPGRRPLWVVHRSTKAYCGQKYDARRTHSHLHDSNIAGKRLGHGHDRQKLNGRFVCGKC